MTITRALGFVVVVLAILGLVGVSLPAQAVWFAILVLAVAVLAP